jgi:hypothetical protein
MAGWNFWKRILEVAGFAVALVAAVYGVRTYYADHGAATTAGSVAPDYRGPWHGQLLLPVGGGDEAGGVTFNFTLNLHSGGLHSVVGHISSPQFDCAAAVSLDGGSGNGPYVLGLTASGSSPVCQVVQEIQKTTIALSGNFLQLTVQFDGGMSGSCDLSR